MSSTVNPVFDELALIVDRERMIVWLDTGAVLRGGMAERLAAWELSTAGVRAQPPEPA